MYRSKIVTTVMSLCCILLAQQEHEHRQSTFKYDTEGIKLQGTLVERTFHGPPGFDENTATDVRDRVLVLRLARPITVEPAEDAEARSSPNLDTVRDVSQVQLFFAGSGVSEVQARKLIGKALVAVGTLDEAVAPRQYTKVTMNVKTLGPK
ncbi:MAG: hypothetical protein ACLP59_24725 [Bryobacteraceae bacterium]